MNQLDIIIKEVDKGEAVTVFSKNHYRAMMNTLTIKTQTKNRIKFWHHYYEKNLKTIKQKNIFTDKEFNYLNETDYSTSHFYWLPKIQKSRLITNAIKEQNSGFVSINEPQDLKVRPTVGEPKCPIIKLSELIDTLLKPLLKHVKTYRQTV